MKYFRKIKSAEPGDVWSPVSDGLQYRRRPGSKTEFFEALAELNQASGCVHSGHCCRTAPELTLEEERRIAREFPDQPIGRGQPCPFHSQGRCDLHDHHGVSLKPVQCRSFVCKPAIRNKMVWLGDFCDFFGFRFEHDQ